MSLIRIPSACALVLTLFSAAAQEDGAEAALTLDDAAALALQAQPRLLARQAAVRAAQESAHAAGQLPDPQLSASLGDLPLSGPERYSLRKESDTQIGFGLMQEFPRGRAQQQQRAGIEALFADAERARVQREIQRDAALAWLEVWKPEREREITRASEQQTQLQLEAAQIAYRSNRATQAEVLAARLALEGLRDRLAALEQEGWHARNLLARWIGPPAFGLLCPELPEPRPGLDLDSMLEKLRAHPHLSASRAQTAVAQAEVALAEQNYRPGWSAELGYGYRPAFSDYASLKFTFDLPVFTRQRQDRALAAALARQEQTEQSAEDDWREHAAELRLNLKDFQLLQARLARFDELILPAAAQRAEAARLAWQSGPGTLAQVLDARRAELDLRTQRLELQMDQARHQVQLGYLTGDTP